MLKTHDEELLSLTDREIELAKKYAVERKEYGEKTAELGIIMAANMALIHEKKKSAGVDMAERMLIAEKPELGQLWADIQRHLNNYKSIEKMIDAVRNKQYAIKEIMRYNRTNDGGM